MSQLPAMPVWWADFFNKTDHLSNAEQWAYAKLLAKTWLRNCRPIPDNDKDVARLLDLSLGQWLKIRPRIAPFFDLSQGTWRQPRLEEEFEFVKKRAEQSRSNGSRGGRPKNNKNNEIENPVGSVQATQEEPTYTHTKKEGKEGSVGSNEPTAVPASRFPIDDLVLITSLPDPKKVLYDYGKHVLGKGAGGQITGLIRHFNENLDDAMDFLRLAANKSEPGSYVARVLRGETTADTNWDIFYQRMGVSPSDYASPVH